MPATTLLSTSRKTFWALLSLILFLQTACKSSHENQEATEKTATTLAEKKTSKKSRADKHKNTKKQRTQRKKHKTIPPRIEKLIQGLNVPEEKVTSEWLTNNLSAVQKALRRVAQGEPYSNVSPLTFEEWFDKNTTRKFSLLAMALYYDCDDQLFDYLKEKVGTEQCQDLGISNSEMKYLARVAPYRSLVWLIENRNAFKTQKVSSGTLANLAANTMFKNEQKLALIEQGFVRADDRTHLLHMLAGGYEASINFIEFLLLTDYKKQLNVVDSKNQTPWEVAANQTYPKQELIETFIHNISAQKAEESPADNTHLQRAQDWINKNHARTYRFENIPEKPWETVRNAFLKIGIKKWDLPPPSDVESGAITD